MDWFILGIYQSFQPFCNTSLCGFLSSFFFADGGGFLLMIILELTYIFFWDSLCTLVLHRGQLRRFWFVKKRFWAFCTTKIIVAGALKNIEIWLNLWQVFCTKTMMFCEIKHWPVVCPVWFSMQLPWRINLINGRQWNYTLIYCRHNHKTFSLAIYAGGIETYMYH